MDRSERAKTYLQLGHTLTAAGLRLLEADGANTEVDGIQVTDLLGLVGILLDNIDQPGTDAGVPVVDNGVYPA